MGTSLGLGLRGLRRPYVNPKRTVLIVSGGGDLGDADFLGAAVRPAAAQRAGVRGGRRLALGPGAGSADAAVVAGHVHRRIARRRRVAVPRVDDRRIARGRRRGRLLLRGPLRVVVSHWYSPPLVHASFRAHATTSTPSSTAAAVNQV